jgi:hypothetical protein
MTVVEFKVLLSLAVEEREMRVERTTDLAKSATGTP